MLEEIFRFLQTIDQFHLAEGLESLTPEKQGAFLAQLKRWGPSLLLQQKEALLSQRQDRIGPLTTSNLAQHTTAHHLCPKIGALILAGGQGSRLAGKFPKGLIPLPLIGGKTLLQLACERGVAISSQSKHPLPLAIMTSPLNHNLILTYLEENHFFGLARDQIELFSQKMLPLLSCEGNWILESPGKIMEGPDGNGYALQHFFQSGIWEKWKQRGIEYLNVLPIDNPLADPFDTHLCDYHARHKWELTLKVISRTDPQEKVGVIGLKDGKVVVQEYTELPPDSSRFTLAYIGLFCLSFNLIPQLASLSLPWHLVKKNGAWKCETFLFDLFPHIAQTGLLLYQRERVYAPLKNITGEKSLATVQEALLARAMKNSSSD